MYDVWYDDSIKYLWYLLNKIDDFLCDLSTQYLNFEVVLICTKFKVFGRRGINVRITHPLWKGKQAAFAVFE